MAERITEPRCNWCRHHQRPGPLEHACALGIDIDAIVPRDTFGHHYAIPCNTAMAGNIEKRECDKRDLFTPEEIAAQDAESEAAMNEAVRHLDATLPLIERLKAQYPESRQLKPKRVSGVEACPICKGSLDWSLDTGNHHIAMRCSTPDCIAFIE